MWFIYLRWKGDEAMRYLSALSVAVIAIVFVGSAMAVAPGKTVEFANSYGKVIFDGKVHHDKGLKCEDCHTKIFPMKWPGKEGAAVIRMADITEGRFCGKCHNGSRAFKAADTANCSRCHKK